MAHFTGTKELAARTPWRHPRTLCQCWCQRQGILWATHADRFLATECPIPNDPNRFFFCKARGVSDAWGDADSFIRDGTGVHRLVASRGMV